MTHASDNIVNDAHMAANEAYQMSPAHARHVSRDTMNASDKPLVDLGDILSHSLNEASCAPLELAAAAFARLGSLFADPNVSSKHDGDRQGGQLWDNCSVSARLLHHSACHHA